MKSIAKWLKKYFIPHKENEWKPHFLRHESMLMLFSLIIVIELGFLVQVFVIFDKTNFLASVLPSVLTTLTNEERAQNDVPLLTESKLLDNAAQMKANDMATQGYFAHTSPEGKTPWYWFDQVGYSYTMAGENLAVNFFESSDVAQAWMNSPTHRANIVKKDYTEIGIGIANGVYEGRNTVFVAQLFGTPLKIVPMEVPSPIKETPKTTTIKPKVPTTKPTIPKTTIPIVTTKVAPPATIAVTPIATQVLGEETKTATISHTTNGGVLSYIKSFIQRVLTSPRQYLAIVYGSFAFAIILVLLLALFIKSEIRHPAIMIRGLAMVTVIAVLLFININLLNLKTEVNTTDISTSAIESISY